MNFNKKKYFEIKIMQKLFLLTFLFLGIFAEDNSDIFLGVEV